MKKIVQLVFFFLFSSGFAQTAIHGKVTAQKTAEPLVGVIVIADDTNAVSTDANGNYTVNVLPGIHKLGFKLIGFAQKKSSVEIKQGELKTLDVSLEESSKELNVVVVSASKFEQKIEDVTVSMEVIKPTLVENKNTTSMDDIVDQIPGVSVIDGQANIRGGAGWSYGAGSRVMVLVDDLPELTADAGDAKWSFLPVENLEQVEVIKGASSALFGSSALNGVINIRTAYPRDTPLTKVNVFAGLYDTPNPSYLKWWGNETQLTKGASFFHSRQIKNLDVVIGGHYFKDNGYRQGEHEERFRFNENFRYRFKNIEGLSAGVNFNHMKTTGGLFFIWADDTTGGYRPLGGLDPDSTTLSNYTTYRTTVDPFITYIDQNGNSIKLRTRWFNTINENNTEQGSTGNFYYSELQYQKHFSEQLTVTLGAVRSLSKVKADLYGNHKGNNFAFFIQEDAKLGRFNFSFGARVEKNKVDSVSDDLNSIIRAGINYRVLKETYVRASFGQGYRFPSIAEKFVKTEVGGVFIYPNSSLDFEKGFSSEIGIMQGVRFGNWNGYLDVAGFWTEYKNMIEFVFGPWDSVYINASGLHGYGFRSFNIGDTRIKGVDVSVSGSGEIFGVLKMTVLAGYTFMDPKQVSFDSAYVQIMNSPLGALLTGKNSFLGSDSSYFLKYRFNHMIKADVELAYKKIAFGVSMRYNSFMKNVDKAFVQDIQISPFSPAIQIVPGLADYRKTHHSSDVVFDTRLSYQATKFLKAAFIVKNIFNREYMGRPADLQPPRSFTVQLGFQF
jgi:outer membrane cobalamin receptor